jgi:hypothetical protein
MRGLAPLSLLGPRVTTAARLWLCNPGANGGRWDDALTAPCSACGQRFPVPTSILKAIAALSRNAGLGPDDNPFPVGEEPVPARLPAEAWEEPALLSECPLCHAPLKFNPFVVDNQFFVDKEFVVDKKPRPWWRLWH